MNLKQIFLKHGVLTEDQLGDVEQHANGCRLDRFVIANGFAREEQVLRALSCELGIEFVDLQTATIDRDLLAAFPARVISRTAVFPLHRRNGTVVVATSDPFNFEALDEISSIIGQPVEPVLVRQEELNQAIKRSLGVAGGTIGELAAQSPEEEPDLGEAEEEGHNEVDKLAQHSSVIKLVNELLLDALEQRASDIHLEPEENGVSIRYRVDGLLQVEPVSQEINRFRAAIISRLKIMAKLNIAEKRLPQDGRLKFRAASRDIDVRVSVIPMLHGEGIVLRLLDKNQMVFDLRNLDLPGPIDTTFRRLIKRTHGIILVTGPTGSGKTTTLYSALAELRGPTIKIVTIEDPVEYHLAGISQIQTHGKIGLTFATGLRSVLRHDPDVILIGEIRDLETATNATQAALTGHLVFSTLHTNDAPSAFTRLIDMGVEPYLVASTVEAVLAQRLVRRLCVHCKVPYAVSEAKLPADFPKSQPETLWKAKGCRECHMRGYFGRTAIFELLTTDPEIRHLCTERVSAARIRDYETSHGVAMLRDSGWDLVVRGITSVDEVLRVTGGE